MYNFMVCKTNLDVLEIGSIRENLTLVDVKVVLFQDANEIMVGDEFLKIVAEIYSSIKLFKISILTY